MKVKRTKWTVPNRQVYFRWVEGRVDQLQAGLDSEEGGFQVGERGSRVVLYSVHLLLARYIYLLGTVKPLCDDEAIAWQARWRYIERFMRQYCLGSINTGSHLFKQLVAAFREKRDGRRNMIISSLARGFRDGHMLSKAVGGSPSSGENGCANGQGRGSRQGRAACCAEKGEAGQGSSRKVPTVLVKQ